MSLIYARGYLYYTQIVLILCFFTPLIISLSISILHNDLIYLLAGLRWSYPILLGILLIGQVSKKNLSGLTNILGIVFILSFSVQIIQVLKSSHWYGTSFLGISKRNPGLFLIPNTKAFFTLCTMFFFLFFKKKSIFKTLVLFLIPISIFITASGAGIATYLIILSMYGVGLVFNLRIPVSIIGLQSVFISLFTIFLLPIVINRPNLVTTSGWERVKKFTHHFDSSFFSSKFGTGSNSAVLLENFLSLEKKAQIVDSTLGSILANLGWVGIVLLGIGMTIWISRIIFIRRNLEIITFTCLFLLFSLTTIITEAYPMNLLFSLLSGHYIGQYFKVKKI